MKKLFILIVFVFVLVVVYTSKEGFSAVGTEVWQSRRMNHPIMDQDPFERIKFYRFGERNPRNPTKNPFNTFSNNSIGLTIGPDMTPKKGYLKGWSKQGYSPGWWVNPTLLDQEKRWGWYW